MKISSKVLGLLISAFALSVAVQGKTEADVRLGAAAEARARGLTYSNGDNGDDHHDDDGHYHHNKPTPAPYHGDNGDDHHHDDDDHYHHNKPTPAPYRKPTPKPTNGVCKSWGRKAVAVCAKDCRDDCKAICHQLRVAYVKKQQCERFTGRAEDRCKNGDHHGDHDAFRELLKGSDDDTHNAHRSLHGDDDHYGFGRQKCCTCHPIYHRPTKGSH